MTSLHRFLRNASCGCALLGVLAFAGTAAAISWTYLEGPFGGQPSALFNDAVGNTWAGMNGTGVFYRPAGSPTWIARPGVPTQSNYQFAIGGTGTVYVSGSAGVFALEMNATVWQQASGSNGLPGQAGGGLTTDATGAVYAGMNGTGNVYRLGSGATTWTAVGAGLPAASQVSKLVFDGAGNLWAAIYGAGIFKLPAASGTWTAMNASLAILDVNALAVVGTDLFAGLQFGGVAKLANASGGGSIWVPWNGGDVSASDGIYAFARGNANTLYAAGYGKVYALPVGSGTWATVGTGLAPYSSSYGLVYSVVDGSLTVSNGGGAFGLAAGGTTWLSANAGMSAATIDGLAVAANGDVYAATFGQGVQRLSSGSSTWVAVDPARVSSVVQAVAIDGPGNVFAAAGGMVFKLAGGTWSSSGTGQPGSTSRLGVDGANNLWAGQSGGTVYKLPAGASAWSPAGSGLPAQAAFALAFDNAGTAYAALPGFGVYVLPVGGSTWTAINGGLPDLYVRALARDAAGTMYAGSDSGVFKRVAGAWQPVGSGFNANSVQALAFDTNGDLYAATYQSGTRRLAAGGSTWSRVAFGLDNPTQTALAVGGGHVYVGTDASFGAPSGVFRLQPLPSVVEFRNTTLDHFFITADPNEQAAVAGGAAGPGWVMTGNFFVAGGAFLVCRFYGSLSPGPNSHFYTIDPAECQVLKDLQLSTPAAQKRWNFESNDFASSKTVGGQCASDQSPVYRAYNNGFARGIDSNHRITSDVTAYKATVASGWIGEGVVMCAPK